MYISILVNFLGSIALCKTFSVECILNQSEHIRRTSLPEMLSFGLTIPKYCQSCILFVSLLLKVLPLRLDCLRPDFLLLWGISAIHCLRLFVTTLSFSISFGKLHVHVQCRSIESTMVNWKVPNQYEYVYTIHPREYAYGSLSVVIPVYASSLSVSLRIISLTLEQSRSHPSASEATMKNIDQSMPCIHWELLM